MEEMDFLCITNINFILYTLYTIIIFYLEPGAGSVFVDPKAFIISAFVTQNKNTKIQKSPFEKFTKTMSRLPGPFSGS